MKTNNNIPAYRFQGYTDAWELRKLGEVAISFDYGLNSAATEYDGENKYLRITDIDDDSREFNVSDLTSPEINLFGLDEYRLSIGDILFARTGASVGKSYIYRSVDGKVYFAGFLIRVKIKDTFNPDFVFQNTLTSNYERFISITSMRSGQPGVNAQEYSNYEIMFPSLPEQEAIGTFFSTLDQHITLHQRKLDTLKEQKKTYLKLLFPAKGQTKPVLRFRGFEDDWEEVKLGELCDIRTGKLDANAMVENGEYDFYTSGIKKYRIDVAEFEGPAITIAGNGATVGYMHLADGKFNAYQRTYVLTNFKVDRSYIFSEIAKKLPIKIQQEARTGNIPYIVLSMLTELSISLPSLPEQEAIGTFFQTLDQEIAQVEDKLASLKEMKKTLLRKLFV